MTNFLLSICIPTANRKKELGEQIETLLSQAKFSNLLDKIQIIISDNTNDSEQLIDMDAYSCDSIKYIKNHSNIGYARNVNNLLLNSDGLFSWLLSDDDLLVNGALEKVYKTILSYPEATYITFINGGMSGGKIFSNNMYFNEKPSAITFDGMNFLENFWRSIIFISVNIFNTKLVKNHIADNNYLENINEVYQNSLIGITLVARYGKVVFIDNLLLYDNYSNKIYQPENINNVSVDKYRKLHNQLKNYGVSSRILEQMSRELVRNAISYGLLSLVYNIEFAKVPVYKSTYWNIVLDNNSALLLRLVSLVIVVLLILPAFISKTMTHICLFITSGKKYSDIVNYWKKSLSTLSNKIPSSY